MDVHRSIDKLEQENHELKLALDDVTHRLEVAESRMRNIIYSNPLSNSSDHHKLLDDINLCEEDSADIKDKALSIVVLGASGDLAKKKTFPALFRLHVNGLLPSHTRIIGFARSDIPLEEYRKQISQSFKGGEDKREEFLSRCTYFRGQYDDESSFADLHQYLNEVEQQHCSQGANRIVYFAVPPSVFLSAASCIKKQAMSKKGWNRMVLEKPFGNDSETASKLGKDLAKLFDEDQMYRIDHYLGKEMVQNLIILRFGNEVFEPVWNRHHIASVQITFKEPFGTQGRGGYFDGVGIIRDVMQNHLIQILALVAMEPPVSLNAEDVRDEKAKLLRAIPPLVLDDMVVGQYGPDPSGKEPSYLDDPTVPSDSLTPTYACAVLHINNTRWKGTPFILKCGKGLNERKADIRIQFRKPANNLFLESVLPPNELVMRVQPDEAVYMKMTTKKPGLTPETVYTEMDLSYKDRFTEEGEESLSLPDAYERLILDVVRGDHNLFVRHDELMAAWDIFTPALHQLEKDKVKPIIYEYGSRGPEEADDLIKKYGYERIDSYQWKPKTPKGKRKDDSKL